MCCDDVSWRDYVFEAVPTRSLATIATLFKHSSSLLCDNLAFVIVSTRYQHSLVVQIRHTSKRGVTLYNHARVELDVELLADILNALLLMLAAAIGEEYERYSLSLKEAQCIVSTWYRVRGSQQNAVNAVSR